MCKTNPKQKQKVGLVQYSENNPDTDFAPINDNAMYAFSVCDKGSNNSFVNTELGGVKVNLMIDSGASANIVNEAQWKHLKSKGIKYTSTSHVSKPLYRYGRMALQNL